MKKSINCIVALDEKGGLAKNGNIPWRSPKDLKFFKDQTTNNIVIMGLSTFRTLLKPFPNRYNIIVTSNVSWYAKDYIKENVDNVMFVNMETCEMILKGEIKTSDFVPKKYDNEIYLIGGKRLLDDTLRYCGCLFLTTIKGDYECDIIMIKEEMTMDYEMEKIYDDDVMMIERWKLKNYL